MIKKFEVGVLAEKRRYPEAAGKGPESQPVTTGNLY
jgi:hypothetical protein